MTDFKAYTLTVQWSLSLTTEFCDHLSFMPKIYGSNVPLYFKISLYFKTTCHLRTKYMEPKGGHKIDGSTMYAVEHVVYDHPLLSVILVVNDRWS